MFVSSIETIFYYIVIACMYESQRWPGLGMALDALVS